MTPRAFFALILTLGVGCANDHRVCDDVTAEKTGRLPRRLSEAGLYAEVAGQVLADDVLEFAPRFGLWTDGAAKRRWLKLPPGATIDTGDMDAWQFPDGTKLFKEFARDDVLVETRLLQKTGPAPDDWVAASYIWNDDLTDANLALFGEEDARATAHDVPAARDCMGCHGAPASKVLGLSAVQLSYDAPLGLVDLDDLVVAGLVSDPPAERLEVPGNAAERAALGYLHANCAHCHLGARPERTGARCYDPEIPLFDFRLLTSELGTVDETRTYGWIFQTGMVVPGAPEESFLLEAVSFRGTFPYLSMPPLGTEIVDDEGLAVLTRWIEQMPR